MTPLAEARAAARFGGKAAGLARLLAAGLPVPPGFAVDAAGLAALATPEGAAAAWARITGPLAVRSSAPQEDGPRHSFAGQHASVLGVSSAAALARAAATVQASAAGSAAYRAAHGLPPVQLAAVVQGMVEAVVAGVLFTRDPLTGADRVVIEAAWGLGEAVVQGLVTPDHVHLDADGGLLRYDVGEKDVALHVEAGEVVERGVPADAAGARCLDAALLARLARLRAPCEAAVGGPADVEWVWDGAALWVVQARPITAGQPPIS